MTGSAPTGIIFDIKRYAIHDGPGIRVTVFFQGCPLRCPWCHNPEGQEPHPRAREPEDSGRNGGVVTVDEVLREIEKDILFFDESGGGVTFSGGEPLMQPEFLDAVLRACKAEDLHTTLDTCGHADPDVLASIVRNVDLVLYDLKLIDDREHRKHTGVSNSLILDNLRMLDEARKQITVRLPVVPRITDTEENLTGMIDFLLSLKGTRHLHLLPYHGMAAHKYKKIGLPYALHTVHAPSPETMAAVKLRLERRGFSVHIGG